MPLGQRWQKYLATQPQRLDEALGRFREAAPYTAAYGGVQGMKHAALGALTASAPEIGVPLQLADRAFDELKELPNRMREFSEQIHNANRALAPFAPRLAMADAMLQLHEFRRTMALASATENTAVDLTRSVDRTRDSFLPYDVLSRNVQNMAGGAASAFTRGAADEGRTLVEILEWLRGHFDQGWIEQFAEIMGKSFTDAAAGIIPGGTAVLHILEYIKDWLQIKTIEPVIKEGPWEAMIKHQAGPLRAAPLHGGRQINPADPWPPRPHP
jgi:hypothetical protein